MVNLERRAGLGLALAWLAAGCAAPGDAPVSQRPQPTGLLTPWLTLTGGWRFESASAGGLPGVPGMPGMPGLTGPSAAPQPAAPPMRIDFRVPIALAALDDQVVIADAGWRQLLRYDRTRDRLSVLAPMSPDPRLAIQIVRDGTAWIAEAAGGTVRQVDRTGRTLRVFRDDIYAAQPVGVAFVPEAGGDVFVADAQQSHIAVFNAFGRAFRRFGEGQLQSVTAMTAGPLGLYVLDRIAQRVVVFSPAGQVLLSLGEDGLVMPRAIAVDRDGRIFVADDADPGAIQVFAGGQRIARYTGTGSATLRKIEALAVDGNQLYVADGVNARVYVLLVAPDSLLRPPKS